MMDDRNLEPLPDLPPDLAELDRELSDLGMVERPSFAPELEAELAREWTQRPPGGRSALLRHGTAVAAVAVAVLGLSVPPARASLVDQLQRMISVLQVTDGIEVELPVDAEEELPIGEADLVIEPVAADPPSALLDLGRGESVGELSPFVRGITTYPTLIDRNADVEAARNHYPRALQLAGVGGTVGLELWVDSTGAVDHVQIRETSGTPELDRAALVAARDLRFNPLTRNGRPGGTWVTFPLTFTPTAGEALLPGIDEPEVPEGLDFEVPDDWAEAIAVPAPILLETRDLLAAALRRPSDSEIPGLGSVQGLLDGDPPAGVNPLQWRSEAAETLQEAMSADPDNPAPYLALARIRRKQGLRHDARLLFERGIERAEKGTRPISPRLVAELAWEHGRVTREAWLGWRGLGEVSSDALRASSCGVVPGSGVGPATPEDLIAWNFNCPQALGAVFAESFVSRSEGDVQADQMLASFRRAVDAYPAHVEANTEILLALADEEAWLALLNQSRRFARASQGHPWAYLMSGLALHRLGRSEESMEDFRRAFVTLGRAERQRFEDPGILRVSDDEPAGRAFWRGLDPILNTAVNEREVEHYARAAYAFLRFGSLEADASRVWLRYGRPESIRAFGSGSGIRTEFWDYGQGSDITFHRPMSSANGALTPESEAYLADLRDVFPHRYGTRARGSYSLPVQLSHFRGRMIGSTEVEFHFEIPAELLSSAADSLHLGVFYLGAGGEVVDRTAQLLPGDAREVRRMVPIGAEMAAVAIEVYNPALGVAAGVRVPAHLNEERRGPGISGLMLADPAAPQQRPRSRIEEWLAPRLDARIDDASIGVVFELYDLVEEDGSFRLAFELIEESGAARPLEHRPAGVGSFAGSWTRSADAGVRTLEYSTLDLSSVPAGRYTLRAVVELENGERLVRELGGLARLVELSDAAAPSAEWESDWEMGFQP